MANPQIVQGTLNRLRGSVTVTDFPALNVTAPYLGKEGLGLAFEGESTTFIDTLTGVVTSTEPYQMATLTINLLKTQGIASIYEARRVSLATIGEVTVVTDASSMPTYPLTNSAIENVAPLRINGQDAGYVVTIKGTYLINNDAWDA